MWHNQRRYFHTGQIAICLLYLYDDKWLLTTIKRITKEIDVVDDVGFEAEEIEEYRKYYGRLVLKYHNMAQGEVIDESYRNNDKYEKRAKRTIDVYGYEDDISEQFHRELITPFVDPFEQAEEERIEEEKEQLRQLEIAKVRKVLEMLKPVQRERLIKAILLGMSSRKIAKEEGVYYSVVDKSIAAARKNFKKFYENL